MIRLIALLVAVLTLASGLAWLADRPGSLLINWEGYEAETSVFRAVVILGLVIASCIVVYSLARQIWMGPAMIGGLVSKRRHRRGLEALSQGMIALGAGDRFTATRAAIQARKALPNEPLTHLLRAQAARLSGDSATSRRIFEAMLASPETEQLGLRGLFLEAEAEGETEAARQFAERALSVNPKLPWPAEALFDLQCKARDWPAALETLASARKHGVLERSTTDRRRAVLLTAQAQQIEESDPEKALALALEAHGLARDLVPAAAIAGRLLASRGNTPRATKIVQETWKVVPHPDLAMAYAYARIGDSPRDRLQRVKQLATLYPSSAESAIAVATAAIEAREWGDAREALEGLTEERLTQRVCTLMARVEGGEHADKGRVREWLARAVNAPRDPAWTADGVVSETWQPVSPVTGALDAFQWRVPLATMETRESGLLAAKIEELVALGAPIPVAVAASAATATIIAEAAPAAGTGSPPARDVTPPHPAQPVAMAIEPSAPAATAPAAIRRGVADAEVAESPATATPTKATEAAVARATTEARPGSAPAAARISETKNEPAPAVQTPAVARPAATPATSASETREPAASAVGSPAPAKPLPSSSAGKTTPSPVNAVVETTRPQPGEVAKTASAAPPTGIVGGVASSAAGSREAGSNAAAGRGSSATAAGGREPSPNAAGGREPASSGAPVMETQLSRRPVPPREDAQPRASASAQSEVDRTRAGGEAQIFVPPRAPDDPGTAGETEDVAPPPQRYRTTA